MLEPSYNPTLVLASLAISMMAAFTGLSVTRGLSHIGPGERQLRIAMGAIALGGGIWSMHFIAMLAVRLPVPMRYDVLPTLASALIAILLAGIALLVMHYGRRRPAEFVVAGAALGLGIGVMHYTGMAAIELCTAVYTRGSVVLATLAALAMGILAIWVAYGARTRRNILFATLVLGSSVVVVHFTAMAGTGFLPDPEGSSAAPMLDPQQIALVVMLSAFVICGAFLLTGATFLSAPESAPEPAFAAPRVPATRAPAPGDTPPGAAVAPGAAPEAAPGEAPPAAAGAALPTSRIPVERRGRTEFVTLDQIAALRAEGHYTIAYCCEDKFFCPWSISEAERRLRQSTFFRAHRSYLVNMDKVTGFERHRDGGVCLFARNPVLDRVPVSRNRVPALRDALGL